MILITVQHHINSLAFSTLDHPLQEMQHVSLQFFISLRRQHSDAVVCAHEGLLQVLQLSHTALNINLALRVLECESHLINDRHVEPISSRWWIPGRSLDGAAACWLECQCHWSHHQLRHSWTLQRICEAWTDTTTAPPLGDSWRLFTEATCALGGPRGPRVSRCYHLDVSITACSPHTGVSAHRRALEGRSRPPDSNMAAHSLECSC